MPTSLEAPLTAPLFSKLVIVGLGLIGASICRVARQQNLASTIIGADADPTVQDRALAIDLVDRVEAAAEAVVGADLVILCTPLGAMKSVAEAIGPHLRPGTIVSDVGGAKVSVVADVGPALPEGVHFIPAIRLRARNIPVRTRGFRRSSSIDG